VDSDRDATLWAQAIALPLAAPSDFVDRRVHRSSAPSNFRIAVERDLTAKLVKARVAEAIQAPRGRRPTTRAPIKLILRLYPNFDGPTKVATRRRKQHNSRRALCEGTTITVEEMETVLKRVRMVERRAIHQITSTTDAEIGFARERVGQARTIRELEAVYEKLGVLLHQRSRIMKNARAEAMRVVLADEDLPGSQILRFMSEDIFDAG